LCGSIFLGFWSIAWLIALILDRGPVKIEASGGGMTSVQNATPEASLFLKTLFGLIGLAVLGGAIYTFLRWLN
jgi:hypothetical protein